MKHPITKLNTDLNNIQALPDVIIGQAVSLKATFDESGNDIKVYVNTVLTEELNGSDGANKIGLTNPNLSADNVGDGVEEVRQIAVQAQSGTILPNSITNEQLSADVKVGSLGSLTTTNKTSVTASINELDAEVGANTGDIATNTANISTTALNLDILRTAKITTGSSVAIAVDTDGTFDLTRNGNILHIIPNVTSTGGMTINVDGQGAIGIRKANDAGTLVALEAGDIKINVPTQLVRDTVNNFFVYAPRGGGGLWLNDWNAYEIDSKYGTSQSIANGVWHTIVNITSGEGFLMDFRVSHGGSGRIPDIRVEVDDFALKDIITSTPTSNMARIENIINQPIQFSKSLKVSVLQTGTSTTLEWAYSTFKKTTTPSKANNNILSASSRNMVLTSTESTSTTNVVSITGSGWLQGVECDMWYASADGIGDCFITIDGVVQIPTITNVNRTTTQAIKRGNKPILKRFNTNLTVAHRTSSAGSPVMTRVWYTLD
jgi:hypothetical protein